MNSMNLMKIKSVYQDGMILNIFNVIKEENMKKASAAKSKKPPKFDSALSRLDIFPSNTSVMHMSTKIITRYL